jgi:hypothetical protein
MAADAQKNRGGEVRKQQPFMPGGAAEQRGGIPTGEARNEDYGQGRRPGAVAGRSDREKAQEAELEMNERNH